MSGTRFLQLNPMVLILINVLAPVMFMFFKASWLQVFLAAFCTLLLIAMGCFKRLFGFFAVYGTMWFILEYSIRTGHLAGLSAFIIVGIQFVPCLFMASVLVSRYTSAQLLSALESIHLPRGLVVATTITLKYIPTFRREFSYIKESMRLRGIAFTWKSPLQSFRYFIVPQLFRCAALAEEVTAAGLVKGIDAPVKRSSFYEQKFGRMDFVVLVLFLAGAVGGGLWVRL